MCFSRGIVKGFSKIIRANVSREAIWRTDVEHNSAFTCKVVTLVASFLTGFYGNSNSKL